MKDLNREAVLKWKWKHMTKSKNTFFLFQMIFLGFEINLVWAVLLFFSIYMVIFSFLINLLEPVTPKIISDAFGYGKTTNSNLSALIKFIQVPKAYFTHFYIFATLFMGSLWIFTIKIVLLEHGLPSEYFWIRRFLFDIW